MLIYNTKTVGPVVWYVYIYTALDFEKSVGENP